MAECEYHEICGREALDGHNGRCILHSEDLNKDKEAFDSALEVHQAERGPDFCSMVFPFEARFVTAIFKDKARFEGAIFKGKAHFEGAIFKDNAAFAGAVFEDEALFVESVFEGKVNFTGAVFEDETFFVEAVFENEATFVGAVFKGQTLFVRAVSKEEFGFEQAVFKDEAGFVGAIFKGKANFDGANFEDRTVFDGANFEARVGFWGSVFKDKATFEEAVFEDKATFEKATFKDRVYFGRTIFKGWISFDRATFEGRVVFAGLSESVSIFADGEVEFTNVEYAQNDPPQFRYADLSRCLFLRTDLRKIDFTGVQWCKKISDGEWFSRVGVYDEIAELEEQIFFQSPHWRAYQIWFGHNRSNEGTERSEDIGRGVWPEIERLYRQLKKNYEDRGDFPRAGDFHIGEKEARRQNPDTSESMRLLLATYRALSKYGERVLPALFWLMLVVAGCAFGYSLLGATPEGSQEALSGVRALVYSAEATFYPIRPLDLEDTAARALSLFQKVVSPLLIALLVLALRQRVKR